MSGLEQIMGLAALGAGAYFVAANVAVVPHDFISMWRGVDVFASGRSPYVRHPTTSSFLFATSAAILLWPEAASRNLSSRLWGLVNLVGLSWLALATWLAVRREGVAASRAWCWAMLATACFLCGRMGRGNADIVTASLMLASLILVSGQLPDRLGRFGQMWMAGVALGLALATKLTALPALLIFVLLGEWAASAVAIVIPLGLSGVAVLRVHQMGAQWIRWTLPYLRHRSTTARASDVSFRALFTSRASAHDTLWIALGLGIVVCVAWFSRLWQAERPRCVSTLVLVGGLLSVVLFLSTPGSFAYYWVYALPALVVAGRDRVASVLAVVGLVGLAVPGAVVDHLAKVPDVRLLADTRGLLAFLLLGAAIALAWPRRPAVAGRLAASGLPDRVSPAG